MRYAAKRITIDAVQWTGTNLDEIQDFAGHDFIEHDPAAGHAWIRNAMGPYPMHPGYWAIRQPDRRPLRVCSPEAFEATFEPAP